MQFYNQKHKVLAEVCFNLGWIYHEIEKLSQKNSFSVKTCRNLCRGEKEKCLLYIKKKKYYADDKNCTW